MTAEVDTFSSAINFWKNANLGSLQTELDQQGLEIIEKQKDGLISRKKLAEQTRGIHYAPTYTLIRHMTDMPDFVDRFQKASGRREVTTIQRIVERYKLQCFDGMKTKATR
jgi:hypothetical protein